MQGLGDFYDSEMGRRTRRIFWAAFGPYGRI